MMLNINNLQGVVVCGRDVENAIKQNPLKISISIEQSMMVGRQGVRNAKRHTIMNRGISKIEKRLLSTIKRENLE